MFRRAAGPGWPAPAGWAACQRHGQRTRGTWPAALPAAVLPAGGAPAVWAGGGRHGRLAVLAAGWGAPAGWGARAKCFAPPAGWPAPAGWAAGQNAPPRQRDGAPRAMGPPLTGPPAAGPVSPVPAGMDRARPRSGAPPPAGETPAPANRPAAPRNRRPWGEARCLRAPKARPPRRVSSRPTTSEVGGPLCRRGRRAARPRPRPRPAITEPARAEVRGGAAGRPGPARRGRQVAVVARREAGPARPHPDQDGSCQGRVQRGGAGPAGAGQPPSSGRSAGAAPGGGRPARRRIRQRCGWPIPGRPGSAAAAVAREGRVRGRPRGDGPATPVKRT